MSSEPHSVGNHDSNKRISPILNRRSATKKIATIGTIVGLGAAGYLTIFTRRAAAAHFGFDVEDTTIATADGEVESVNLETTEFLIEYVNLSNQDDVTATLELTDESDHIDETEEITAQADITLPANGPNGEHEVSALVDTFDLLEETELTAADFENSSDGTTVDHTLEFRATVSFSDHQDLDEDFEETTQATVSVQNASADADVVVEGETDGEAETDPGDLHD